MNELKPCPFCGSKAEISSDTEATKDSMGRLWAYTVVCSRCCASSGLTYTHSKAIEAWNRRANDAPSVDAVDVVRCKDCECFDGVKCTHPQWEESTYGVYEDDFCSYGERRGKDG